MVFKDRGLKVYLLDGKREPCLLAEIWFRREISKDIVQILAMEGREGSIVIAFREALVVVGCQGEEYKVVHVERLDKINACCQIDKNILGISCDIGSSHIIATFSLENFETTSAVTVSSPVNVLHRLKFGYSFHYPEHQLY